MPRRPRDRRAQIVTAASTLFHQQGYRQVNMAQIAAAVGITASALYRHFPGKRQLLTAVIAEYFTRLERDASDPEPALSLPDVVRRLAAGALDRREPPLLWAREARHLNDGERAELRERLRGVADAVAKRLRAERPELTDADAQILVWRAIAVLTSPSYHRVELPRPRFERMLVDMTMAVLTLTPPRISAAEVAAAGPATPVPRRPVLPRVSRREALLSAALHLFAERGYHDVTVDDIGAAVGIAGPSVYNHFPSKSAFLTALVNRGAEYLSLAMSQVLEEATDPATALADLLRCFAGFAWDHEHLTSMLVGEVHNLPEEDLRQVRSTQREYVAELFHLLRLANPTIQDEGEARVRVHAALNVVNHLARTRRARRIPALRDHALASALAAMGIGRHAG
ncbi:MAG TPA: helix-turn-helix domain-containing protein [Pseudonocardiaceae bacterium]